MQLIFLIVLLPIVDSLAIPGPILRPILRPIQPLRPGILPYNPLPPFAIPNPGITVIDSQYSAGGDSSYEVDGVAEREGNNEYDYEDDGYNDGSLEDELRDDQLEDLEDQGASGPFPIDFMLYTRQNKENPEFIEPDNLGQNFISGSSHKGTVFIIHGFTDSGYGEWVQDMKSELLQFDNLNVIVVNWKEGAKRSGWRLYVNAAHNTRYVGLRTAELIRAIFYQKLIPESKIHMIGHSLGAHCSGFTGKNVKSMTGKIIGRISGLDPAGPLFANSKPDQRLDKSDAKFVDIIHTNDGNLFRSAFGWKKNSPLGHVDFYPNGGSKQPGCPRFRPSTCNHIRAPLLFTNSIRICQYQTRTGAANCPNGLDTGVKMGYHSYEDLAFIGTQGKTFCLETTGSASFCGTKA